MKKIFFVLALCAASVANNAIAATISAPAKEMEVTVGQGVSASFDSAISTVFIADPQIASYQVVDNSKILVFGKNPGRTSLFVMDPAGRTEFSSTVNVVFDTAPMKKALKSEFPSLDLKLTPALDGVAVSGKVPSAEMAAHVISVLDSFLRIGSPSAAAGGAEGEGEEKDADLSGSGLGSGTMAMRNGKIINRLTITMPTQVTVRVKIAEVSKDLKEQLGFQWGYALNNSSRFALGFAGSTVLGNPGLDGGSAFVEGLSDASKGAGVPDVTALLNLLSSENLVSVLAEPNLSASSGETASFLVGGKLKYPVTEDGDITLEDEDFGIMLSMTPTILSPNKISIRLRPEVSEPDYSVGVATGGNVAPGLKIRRVETTVELASGQSYVIGGLLQNDILDTIDKVPGLGDIPVFGALARSSKFERGETELVIIVTAHITEPTDGTLRIPNAQIYTPSVFERLLYGKKHDFRPGSINGVDFIL